ncbi:MAG: hypothetical protein ACREYE_33255 [Gammaproteobacteria bacterium]
MGSATVPPVFRIQISIVPGLDMAILGYRELYGESPDAEIIGKLTMLTDLEPDD